MHAGAASSSTRGLFLGGFTILHPPNVIDKITIATTGQMHRFLVI